MFALFTVHTDECTYSYENLLVVIPEFTPENINKLSDHIKKSYELNEDQFLQLLDYENFENDGVVLKENNSGFTAHLIIKRVDCL